MDIFFKKNSKKLSFYLQDFRFMSIFAPKMHFSKEKYADI